LVGGCSKNFDENFQRTEVLERLLPEAPKSLFAANSPAIAGK